MAEAASWRTSTAAPVATAETRPFLALLRAEWLSNRVLLSAFFAVWFIGLWVIPLILHPMILILFGIFYAAAVPSTVAGADILDGCEEFRLALPLTRSDYYISRLALTGIPILVYQGIGAMALYFAWPQALWGLIVDSGFTLAQRPEPPFLYVATLVVPLSVYAVCFAVVTNVHTARDVSRATLMSFVFNIACVFAGVTIGSGGLLVLGRESLPLVILGLNTALSLILGYRFFCEKQCSGADGVKAKASVILWILGLVIFCLVLVAVLL